MTWAALVWGGVAAGGGPVCPAAGAASLCEFARRPGSATVLNARRSDQAARPRMMGCHADVAQLVEHHLAKVRVAGSNPVVRSGRRARCQRPARFSWGPYQGRSWELGAAEWPSGLGKGLQSPVRGFDCRLRLKGD